MGDRASYFVLVIEQAAAAIVLVNFPPNTSLNTMKSILGKNLFNNHQNMYFSLVHSILEDVLVKIFFPKTIDDKFIIWRPVIM